MFLFFKSFKLFFMESLKRIFLSGQTYRVLKLLLKADSASRQSLKKKRILLIKIKTFISQN